MPTHEPVVRLTPEPALGFPSPRDQPRARACKMTSRDQGSAHWCPADTLSSGCCSAPSKEANARSPCRHVIRDTSIMRTPRKPVLTQATGSSGFTGCVGLSLLLLLFLGSAATPANNAVWKLAASARDYSVYVDISSLQRTRKAVKAWQMVAFESPRRSPKGTYRSSRQLAYCDCPVRVVAIKVIESHSGEGNSRKACPSA